MSDLPLMKAREAEALAEGRFRHWQLYQGLRMQLETEIGADVHCQHCPRNRKAPPEDAA